MFEFKQHVKGVYGERITVRFPPEIAQQLEGISRSEKWKMPDMIREAVEVWLTEYFKRPQPKQPNFKFG